jgi:hypothetical protein
MRSRKYLKGGVTTVEPKVEPKVEQNPKNVPKAKPVLQEDKCVKQSDECVETCKKTAATCATKEIEENKVNAGVTGASGATEVKPGFLASIKNLFGKRNEVAAKKDTTVANPMPEVATPKGGKRKSKPKSRKRKSKRKPRQRKSRKN